MKTIITSGCLLLVLGAMQPPSIAASSPAPWNTIVIGKQAECERLATNDLRRYLAQVTGVVPAVIDAKAWRKHPSPAVALGSPGTNALVGGSDADLGAEGYLLANKSLDGVNVVVAEGKTPAGVVNAVYGLLRELGYGFYLGSESVPGSIPSSLRTSPIVRKPVFGVRGVLPWCNFFNSPTAWDPIDHRTFVDQLIRSGANFVGFHTYDGEPFGGYRENGKYVWAGRLLNTKTPTWGTNPMPADRFGFGTDKLYADPFFGARTTIDIDDPTRAIEAEQDIMRDALDYARKRGLHTCLGFELWGDPLNPADRDAFLKRLNHLLDQYPSLEYLWIWQAETQGAQGYPEKYNLHVLPYRLDPKSRLPLYGAARREIFHRAVHEAKGQPPYFQDTGVGEAARANEGARLEQFAQFALHAMGHRKGAPKLVISGWGGDERIMSAEYYDGLDKLLPKDVVFSSLDMIFPRDRVDRVYGVLPPKRQRWPIPWMENDGDQWQSQPFVHLYEKMAKDAEKGGSQGILGIHWRTREVEENFAFLVDYAWQPGLTADGFFKDYARRSYSPSIAGEMATIHSDLDKLGYRWVGGGGQGECAPFTWGPGSPEQVEKLTAIRDRAAWLLPRAGKSRERLQWLIDCMDWSLQYYHAEVIAVKAQSLLGQANSASPGKARQSASEALAMLDGDDLGKAMRIYARRVTTRGEYGVLATINTKAYASWNSLKSQCLRILGKGDAADALGEWNPEPEILLPRLIGSTTAGRDLELSPVVLGGEKAWAHYRTLGAKEWRTLPLQEVHGWVRRVTIPGDALAEPGIEVGFSFSDGPMHPMALGPKGITVSPALPVDTAQFVVKADMKSRELRVSVRRGKAVPLEVAWNDIPEADYYRVYRDGMPIVETAVAMMPDSPDQATGVYTVEALRDGKVIAKSAPIPYTRPTVSANDVVKLSVSTNRTGVLLKWPPTQSPVVSAYRLTRTPASGGESQTLAKVVASRSVQGHVYRDVPPTGKWAYSIVPMDMFGNEGTPTTATADFEPRPIPAPVLDLPLTAKPEGIEVVGDVQFGESGAYFKGGYMVLPHRDDLDLGKGMSLTFEFKADYIAGMPVLLSHGAFSQDGWFVQILGGQLIVRTPHGDATGPMVEPGKWYTVRFTYDGVRFGLVVNDQWFDQTSGPITPVPTRRDLIIGHYEIKEPQFAFPGAIRNIRIYGESIL